MRNLIISDIHANYTAFQAVLADAGDVDETWFLGDLVGYGPDPNEVIDRLREIPRLTCLMGNHDAAVVRKIPLETFNGDARRSLEYHEKVVTPANMEYLRSLPQTSKLRGEVTIAHGSPRDPLWEYVINQLAARLNFDHFDSPWCFVGHSHVQCVFALDPVNDHIGLDIPEPGSTYDLRNRLILNPGSVGQPRDRDPRAAYAIYDSTAKTWQPRRVDYNISEVQQRVRDAGLPEKHAVRLAEGW
jgi:diadenosine tetraphosphatase ApaH/serine/threonine PP2A family protein phosphatase